MSDLIPPCPECGSVLPFRGHECNPKPSYEDLELRVKRLEKGIVRCFQDNKWDDGMTNKELIEYVYDEYGSDFYEDLN